MIHRFLLCMFILPLVASAQPAQYTYDAGGSGWDFSYSSDEAGGGTAYLGVDIDDVSAERLAVLKLKEEHGAEVTMVDQDAPAGKAGVHEHDVILSVNGTAVDSAAQLRRIIKETPPGRVVDLGISRDGQPLSIKVQLADRHKSMQWEPKSHIEMPKMPQMPNMPDFDLPVSVVVVHSSARSGLMVENISPQLGEFFGVKGGNGVLVRSVEKGSRGDKAGFRAGDVIVKVNNQPIHETSDFTHAIRSSPGTGASVTVMRDKREQNLTLTLPEKKDSGALLEDSFDVSDFTAVTQEAINRAGEVVARVTPAVMEKVRAEVEEKVQAQAERCSAMQDEMEDRLRESQQMDDEEPQLEDEEQEQMVRHELHGALADI